MSFYGNNYFQGDKIVYLGNNPDIKIKIGEVCAKVSGTNNKYSVEFGDQFFIMSETRFRRYRPSKTSDPKEPEVQVKRSRKYDDVEEE